MAKSKEQSAAGSLIELVTIVAVALGLALGIQAFLVKPFRIPSESMVPTLEVGQRVLVDRVSLRFGDPDRGDIVVFKPPHGRRRRTAAAWTTPRPACPKPTPRRPTRTSSSAWSAVPRRPAQGHRAGRVYINGKLQEEPFIRPDADCAICNLPAARSRSPRATTS